MDTTILKGGGYSLILKKKSMPVPQKIISRKEEITTDFLKLVDKHIKDIVDQKVEKVFHAKDFAERLFIHPRHLTTTIKLTTGKSPCDVMEERIIGEAQKLLLETTLPVADVAARLNYYQPTNFIKFFKGMTGTTPLQYRKQQVV